MSTTPTILFVCVHNAGRSQIAAAFARHFGGAGVTVHSAGSAPGEALNPSVVAAMREVNLDISTESPKKITDQMALEADVVVTMGCGEECPYFPGKRYEDWELEDPAGKSLEVVRVIREDIRLRVITLLADLNVRRQL